MATGMTPGTRSITTRSAASVRSSRGACRCQRNTNSSRRRDEFVFLWHRQAPRLERTDAAERVVIDLVPGVIPVAMFDQHIAVADDIGLTVLEKFEIVRWLDAER